MYKRIKICILCMIFPILAGCKDDSGLYLQQQEENLLELSETEGTESMTVEDTASPTKETEEAKEQKEIYVQVSGAVKRPGVYHLPEGSRIFQAVEMAGGITDLADFDSINQAEVLSDGQMVYVYEEGEVATVLEQQKDDGKIDLNTATKEQLMTLPGVGASKADSIISYRESCGGFQKIEDLMEIEGIKEGVFSKIKDLIKIS